MEFVIKHITYQDVNLLNKIFNALRFLRRDYPGFSAWYQSKVLPGLEDGSRSIYAAFADEEMSTMVGVLILKNDGQEKKICTLCVLNDYRQQGLGTQFIKLAQKKLEADKPLVTVPGCHLAEFDKLFAKFGFECCKRYVGYYRDNAVEYAYNGLLNENLAELAVNA